MYSPMSIKRISMEESFNQPFNLPLFHDFTDMLSCLDLHSLMSIVFLLSCYSQLQSNFILK